MAENSKTKKKEIISKLKGPGKDLEKTLNDFIDSVKEADTFDIKQNKELSELTAFQISKLSKFAKACKEGNLDLAIEIYSGQSDEEKISVPQEIADVLNPITDVPGGEETEEEIPTANEDGEEITDIPPEETEEVPAEEAPVDEVESSTDEEASAEEEEEEPAEEEPTTESVDQEPTFKNSYDEYISMLQ